MTAATLRSRSWLLRLRRQDLLTIALAAGWQSVCAYVWAIPARMLVESHSAPEDLWFEPGGLYVFEALRLDQELLRSLALPWAIGGIGLAIATLPSRFILLRRAVRRTQQVPTLSFGRLFLHQSILASLGGSFLLLGLVAAWTIHRSTQSQVGDLSWLSALPLGLGSLLWLPFSSFSDRSQCELSLGRSLPEALRRGLLGPNFWAETRARLVKGITSLALGCIVFWCALSAPLVSTSAEKAGLEAALGLGLVLDLLWFSWLALERRPACDRAERSAAPGDPS